MDDDDVRETPPVVAGAIAAGVVPVPFLFIYAVLFLVHGTIHPVVPPDITNSRSGEAGAGVIALAAFCIVTVSLLWFMNRRRRWPFIVCQLVLLGVAVDFIVDETIGARQISTVVALACAIAAVLALTPVSGRYVASRWPIGRKAAAPAQSVAASVAGAPDAPRPADPVRAPAGPPEPRRPTPAPRQLGLGQLQEFPSEDS